MTIKTDLFSLKKKAWNCHVSIRIEIKGVSAVGLSTPGDKHLWSEPPVPTEVRIFLTMEQRHFQCFRWVTWRLTFFEKKKKKYQQLQKQKHSQTYVKCNLTKMGFVTLKRDSLVFFFINVCCSYFLWSELTRRLWSSGMLTWTSDNKWKQIKEEQKWKFLWNVLILIKQQKSTDLGWICFYLLSVFH